MVTDSAGTTFRYAAFISYRHVEPDRRWAKWLHAALETYRIPRTISAQRKLGRVFRDEEELPASADLTREIDQALSDSRFLIVICSPRTPASEWVNKEVERFREMGRHGRILAVLIEGEPGEAFPRALCEIRRTIIDDKGLNREQIEAVEPLAADVRLSRVESQRYLRRMAKLRLLACLLGVRFDDLRNREQQRRKRYLAAASCIMVSLVLALTALTLYAFGQKAIAQSATTQAVASAHLAQLRLAQQLISQGDIPESLSILANGVSDKDSTAATLFRFWHPRLKELDDTYAAIKRPCLCRWRGSNYFFPLAGAPVLLNSSFIAEWAISSDGKQLLTFEDGSALVLRSTTDLHVRLTVPFELVLNWIRETPGTFTCLGKTFSTSAGGSDPVLVTIDLTAGTQHTDQLKNEETTTDAIEKTPGNQVQQEPFQLPFPSIISEAEMWHATSLRNLSDDLVDDDQATQTRAMLKSLQFKLKVPPGEPAAQSVPDDLDQRCLDLSAHFVGGEQLLLGSTAEGQLTGYSLLHVKGREVLHAGVFYVAFDRGFAAFAGDYLFVSDMSGIASSFAVYPLQPFLSANKLKELTADILPTGNGPTAFGFSPDQSRLAIATDQGDIWIYKLHAETNSMIRVRRIPSDGNPFVRLGFVSNTQLAVVNENGAVSCMDGESGQRLWSTTVQMFNFKKSDRATQQPPLSASPLGRLLAIFDDRHIQLLDSSTCVPLSDPLDVADLIKAPFAAARISDVVVADDGSVALRFGVHAFGRQTPLSPAEIPAAASRIQFRTGIVDGVQVAKLDGLKSN